MNKFFLTFIFSAFFLVLGWSQEYKTHKVKSGETIEEIAKTYLVTPYDILALNPDAKDKLEPNMVLIIPNSKTKNETVKTQTKELIGFDTHKVKRKETLYGISKKYNVEIDEIKKHNTFLYSTNLKKGDKIKIPKYKTVEFKLVLNDTIRKYKVQPKEGKWRVAYKFGITVPELEALNPNMNQVLQPGDELNVPNIANNEEKTVDENFNYYTVLPKEGFYRLKVKLGLDKEELEALNPELKEGGLKEGMILKLPLDVSSPYVNNNEVESTKLEGKLTNFSPKRLALMMPYRLNKLDIDSVKETKIAIKNDAKLSISLDFLIGAQMALDSAKKMGISSYLKVFDTRDQSAQIDEILKNNDFSNYDAVLGPLMPKHIDRVASHLKTDNVPVISPFSQPSKLYDNVYQTVPSKELLKKTIVNFVKSDSLPKHIVIIADSKHKNLSNTLKTELGASKQIFSRKNKDGKDLKFIYLTDLEKVFKPGKNIVFLETDNEAFVSNVTSLLNGLTNDKQQIILMTTDKNKAFDGENISNYHLSNLKFHFPSVNKPFDYEANNGFTKAYKEIYGVLPNKYTIRGFDLTLDTLLRLASTNDGLFEASNGIETEYIENKFHYVKKLFGGYVNEAVYIVKYDNLSLVDATVE